MNRESKVKNACVTILRKKDKTERSVAESKSIDKFDQKHLSHCEAAVTENAVPHTIIMMQREDAENNGDH